VHPEFQAQPKDELLELIWRRREDGERSVSGLLQAARREAGADAGSGTIREAGGGALGEAGSALREGGVGTLREAGGATLRDTGGSPGLFANRAAPSGAGQEDASEVLRTLEREGLVDIAGDEVRLTAAGEARARTVIRGHRLAKRLLFDVFGLPPDEIERTACLMEHILGPTTADAVCAFLGHPPRSPSGREIPPGDCCQAAQERRVQPLVVPLHELPRGGLGRIAFMTPSYQRRFDRLGTFGVVPGNRIRLKQTQPSVVIEIDGTSLALDRDVAREIYVRRES